MRLIILWNPERKAGHEQEERHEREGGEQEVAPPEGVNRVDGGEGEEEVDAAEAERCEESRFDGEATLPEDGRRIVGDRIYTTYECRLVSIPGYQQIYIRLTELLHKHNNETRE